MSITRAWVLELRFAQRNIRITPIAAIMADRGLPLIFATGYGASALPEGLRDPPHLRKPFLPSQLRAVIDAAVKDKS